MAIALEAFIQDITEKSAALSEQNQDTKILPSHIKEIVLRNPDSHGFLKGLVSSVPDFEVNSRLDDEVQELIISGCKRKAKEAAKMAPRKK